MFNDLNKNRIKIGLKINVYKIKVMSEQINSDIYPNVVILDYVPNTNNWGKS